MQTAKRLLMQGNEACVEGAVAAGVKFFAGYPITPSTEIAELLARRLPRYGGKFIQMEDEISSMAAVVGASLAGLKSMTATSGPGFSLMQENLGFAFMTETPCVVVNVQRLGPSTGGPTLTSQGDIMQARWGTHGDHGCLCFYPTSVLDAFKLTVEAFNWSEKLRMPVIVLMDETIAHLRESVTLPLYNSIKVVSRKRPVVSPEKYLPFKPDEDDIPPMAPFGTGYRYHVSGLVHDYTGFPATSNHQEIERLLTRLHRKIKRQQNELTYYSELFTNDADTVVVACGSVARSAAAAVKKARKKGVKAGLLALKTIWPFPAELVARVVGGKTVKRIIIPEMNTGQLEGEVRKILGNDERILGLHQLDGRLILPDTISSALNGEKPYA